MAMPATCTAAEMLDFLGQSKDKRIRAASRLVGRPMALTRPRAERILGYVMEGLPESSACEAVAITARTLQRYKARAQEFDDEPLESVPDQEKLIVQFCRLLKLAESQAELRLLRQVAEGGKGWQAYMTLLERRWPARWGRQEKRIHEGGDPKKPMTLKVETQEEKRAKVINHLKEAGAV